GIAEVKVKVAITKFVKKNCYQLKISKYYNKTFKTARKLRGESWSRLIWKEKSAKCFVSRTAAERWLRCIARRTAEQKGKEEKRKT
ncbi:hypothetical protein DOY81_003832, partial [Sarcophaga bullata]